MCEENSLKINFSIYLTQGKENNVNCYVVDHNNPANGAFGKVLPVTKKWRFNSRTRHLIQTQLKQPLVVKIILTKDPTYTTMHTELFGPVVTIFVFEDDHWEETLQLVDETSEYALTGAVFSEDRYALELGVKKLQNAAGNFYINDKPTGAVVGQQPFGGARASGTNDKAGSKLNLYRWVSPRMIKETFVTPTDYRYPFLG